MGTIAEAARRCSVRHDWLFVTVSRHRARSGWTDAADVFGDAGADVTAEVSMADLPGFAPPSALGHAGTIRSVRVGNSEVLLLLGRAHAYEGHDLATVVHPVRTAIAAGADTVILTNAAAVSARTTRLVNRC